MASCNGSAPCGRERKWIMPRFIEKKLDRNAPCWCHSGKKYKACHLAFDERIAEFRRHGARVPNHKMIKTPEQMEGIRSSAKVNVAVLDYVAEHIREGITTEEIDRWVYEQTTRAGAIPAPLNYEGFPKSVCTSINDQVSHGIPSGKDVLVAGDIVNIDCSTILNGYFSDSSRMFIIGETTPEKKKLVETTREIMLAGLEQVKPWGFLGDMGQVISDMAHANGYTVVREIGGHGCGVQFHEEPWVSYVTKKGTDMLMVPGMCFTIEPMINMGTDEIFEDADNGWTIYTADGMPSAQWEIQVLVTEDGHEVISW